MMTRRKSFLPGKGMLFGIAWIALGLVATTCPTRAADKFGAGPLELVSMGVWNKQPENDPLLYLTCIHAEMLDIRIGGELGFGKGEHEPVSLSLGSGTLSTRVDGVSVKSPDYEMTGGAMLLTSIEPKGRAIQILTSGKPIEFKPSTGASTTIVLGDSVTIALKSFLDKCSRGDR
jgi:hypothetical protein